MRRLARAVAVLAMGVAAVATAAAPAGAAPGGTPANGCVLVAQQPDERTKTIALVERCGAAAATETAAADVVALAQYFEHAGWSGQNVYVYGAYGTCDREGYTLSVGSPWSGMMSSYRVFGNCYYSTVTNWWGNTRYGAIGDQSYVGDSWNDDVVQFRTWSR
ncbi:hypothetical protein [Virgisporangium aliadipatigenens]|uniref:hypothetical protein n=1 Tax=Virgisporangium aliadipatigenens TaxID=741659 RepID=UPI00194114D9|nr:hypothetical protein [Virgisporangium aliadipatigenens]